MHVVSSPQWFGDATVMLIVGAGQCQAATTVLLVAQAHPALTSIVLCGHAYKV
jgi:hypothetical protein